MKETESDILIIYSIKSSFVRNDVEALKSNFNVIEYEFGIGKGMMQIIKQINLLVFLFLKFKKYQTFFIWFADYHALFPTLFKILFKKKLIVSIGGFDAAKMPELNYGGHTQLLRSKIISFAVKNSDSLIFSSRFTKESLNRIISFNNKELNHIIAYPGINCKTQIINKFQERNYYYCYVALCDSIDKMKVKGVDRFLELVQQTPDKRFVICGLTESAESFVKKENYQNLDIYGRISYENLREIYLSSRFIALFSRFEAFGMVILEGICYGCIPVTLESIGTSEIILADPKIGILLKSFDVSEIKKLSADFLIKYNESEYFQFQQIFLNKHFSINCRNEVIVNQIFKQWA